MGKKRYLTTLAVIISLVFSLGYAAAQDVEMPGGFKLSGRLDLADSTSSSSGMITLGGYYFLHAYPGYGKANIFIGVGAGNTYPTLTGLDNVGLGQYTLGSLTSGRWNTAIGALSLQSNTSGDANTGSGVASLSSNTTGSYNVAVGENALSYNATGNNNTAVGYLAGYVNNGNIGGSRNTYIGANSGPGIPETSGVLTNATAVGYSAVVSQSNSLVLGGTGTYAANVGIGTTTPAYKLDVVGTVRASSFIGDFAGSTHLGDNAIYLRGDTNHALRWAGNTNPFASVNVDGPALYGYSGGVLGTTNGGQQIALQWDASRNVTVGGSLTYAAPKTRHWSIAGSSFVPYDMSANTFQKNGFALFGSTGPFTAPVHLPDGAIVTKMTVYYLDNSSSSFNVSLWLVDMMGGTVENYLAGVNTANTGTSFSSTSTSSISYSTINNSQYAYSLFVTGMDGTANQKFGGVVIEYTVDEPLP